MKRPEPKTLRRLFAALLILAVFDVVLTSIGVLYFTGEEGNLLIVALARCIPWESPDKNVVLAVWLSKIVVMAGALKMMRAAVRSVPERDDKMMFIGLILCMVVCLVVIASWAYFFVLVAPK